MKAAPLDVGGGVAYVQAALDAVEKRRGDRQVAVGGVAVGDALDVAVDPEYLLHHDQPAARLARRLGAICGEFVAVAGRQLDHLAHVLSPLAQRSETAKCTSFFGIMTP
jgi:hypothetical protein